MKNIGIITGASSGMGRDLAYKIAEKYDLEEIWLIARRKERLLEAANEIYIKYGVNCVVIPTDLAEKDSIQRIIDRLEDTKPNIKILVNSSGFGIIGESRKIERKKQEEMILLNIVGLFNLTHICLDYMTKGSGIIQIASSAGYCPQPYFAVYSATKAFVLSYSIALAEELKACGIKLSVLCPGPVETEFFNFIKVENLNMLKKFFVQKSDVVVNKTIKAYDKGKVVISSSLLIKFFEIIMGVPMQYLGSKIMAKVYRNL